MRLPQVPAKLASFFRRHREEIGVKPGPMSQEDRLKVVKKQVDDAKQVARTERLEWGIWRRFYDGELQKVEHVAKGLDPKLAADFVVSNFVKSSLETYVATLMGVTPAWYVVAGNQEQDEAARRLTAFVQAYARAVNLDLQLQMVYEDAVVVGTGALKVYYDVARKDVVVEAIEPQSIYPDPTARSLEKCEFLALRNVYGAGLAERLYPKIDLEKAAEIKEDDTGEIESDEPGERKRVEVWEFYYEFGKKLMVYTGEQVLHDGDNPTPEGRYPVFLFQMPKRVTTFWPTGLVAGMMDMQNLINRTRSRIAIYQRFTANPVWDVDDPQAKETYEITPGHINYLREGTKATPHRPEPLPADMMQTIEMAQHALDDMSGVREVMRGIRPRGVTAGVAIEGLQQTAQIRMTGPARSWNHVLADVGLTTLRLMQKHYSEDRALAVYEGGEGQRVPVSAEDLSTPEATGEMEETGEYDEYGEPEMREEMRAKPYDYHVVTQPGGDLPLSPAAQAEKALQIAQVVPVELMLPELLEQLQFAGRNTVVKRFEQAMAAQQAGQQEGAAMQQQAQQAEAAQMQLVQLEQQLAQMLAPEQMDALREIAEGRFDDDMTMAFFESLPANARELAMQYAQLARQGAGTLQMVE